MVFSALKIHFVIPKWMDPISRREMASRYTAMGREIHLPIDGRTDMDKERPSLSRYTQPFSFASDWIGGRLCTFASPAKREHRSLALF